jgi:hypothetical protein
LTSALCRVRVSTDCWSSVIRLGPYNRQQLEWQRKMSGFANAEHAEMNFVYGFFLWKFSRCTEKISELISWSKSVLRTCIWSDGSYSDKNMTHACAGHGRRSGGKTIRYRSRKPISQHSSQLFCNRTNFSECSMAYSAWNQLHPFHEQPMQAVQSRGHISFYRFLDGCYTRLWTPLNIYVVCCGMTQYLQESCVHNLHNFFSIDNKYLSHYLSLLIPAQMLCHRLVRKCRWLCTWTM